MAKLEYLVYKTEIRVGFYCPGCKCHHAVPFKPETPSGWEWNHDYISPTLSPSLKITYANNDICHLFVRNGKLQFLNDCFHEYKGQTIEMQDVDE